MRIFLICILLLPSLVNAQSLGEILTKNHDPDDLINHLHQDQNPAVKKLTERSGDSQLINDMKEISRQVKAKPVQHRLTTHDKYCMKHFVLKRRDDIEVYRHRNDSQWKVNHRHRVYLYNQHLLTISNYAHNSDCQIYVGKNPVSTIYEIYQYEDTKKGIQVTE